MNPHKQISGYVVLVVLGIYLLCVTITFIEFQLFGWYLYREFRIGTRFHINWDDLDEIMVMCWLGPIPPIVFGGMLMHMLSSDLYYRFKKKFSPLTII